MKGGIQVPSANEVLAQKKAKRRRNSRGTTSKRNEQTTTPVIVFGLPSQGVGSSQAIPEDSDIVSLNFPANASIYSDAPNMVGGIAAWLLPEDMNMFDSLGEGATADWVASRTMQVMSGTLYLKDLVHTQARKNQDLQATNATLCKQVAQAIEREKELMAKSRADLVKYEEVTTKYEKIMSEHQACASQIQCLTDQLQMMAMNASLKTRAELMVEFKAGKSSEWDPDEAIDIWKETEAEMAEEDAESSRVEPAQDG